MMKQNFNLSTPYLCHLSTINSVLVHPYSFIYGLKGKELVPIRNYFFSGTTFVGEAYTHKSIIY